MRNVRVVQNLAEEPGGGVFSMRRVTVHDSVFTGNLANDDGGAIYARRGGVQVYDSLSMPTSSMAPGVRSARPGTSSSCARG